MKRSVSAIAVLCFVSSLACRTRSGGPEPGTELYAVSMDSVTEILVRSTSHKLYAYRWVAQQPFHLVIASDRAPTAEQCTGGPAFERLLQALVTVPVIGESKKDFKQGTTAWADVWLRDTTNLEPIEVRIRIPEANDEPVVIQFEDRQYVVGVDPSVLHTAAAGCDELGKGQ